MSWKIRHEGSPQAVEGLRAGDLVHQVQIDVDEIRFTGLAFAGAVRDDVVGPDLLGHREWLVRHEFLHSFGRSAGLSRAFGLALPLFGTLVSPCVTG